MFGEDTVSDFFRDTTVQYPHKTKVSDLHKRAQGSHKTSPMADCNSSKLYQR